MYQPTIDDELTRLTPVVRVYFEAIVQLQERALERVAAAESALTDAMHLPEGGTARAKLERRARITHAANEAASADLAHLKLCEHCEHVAKVLAKARRLQDE